MAMEKGKALAHVCEAEIIHRPSAEVALIHIQTEQEGMFLLCQDLSVSEHFQNVVMAGPYQRLNESFSKFDFCLYIQTQIQPGWILNVT